MFGANYVTTQATSSRYHHMREVNVFSDFIRGMARSINYEHWRWCEVGTGPICIQIRY